MKKLVRDKIIDIIKANGESPKFKVLNKKEYILNLKKKLNEKSLEVLSASNLKEVLEEIADTQEVLDCLIRTLGSTKKEIKEIQKEKNKERGSFLKRLFLEGIN